jgi:uncharacterized protein YecT (DUF1311 family)
MIRLRLLILLILVGQSILSNAQSQTEMASESGSGLKNAETELNTVYERILVLYKEDTEFLKNLKESQDLWIKFRTMELKTKFPNREPGYYGSVQPMCVNDYLTELTNERIKRLKTWLTGTEEGDVCSGSIRIIH